MAEKQRAKTEGDLSLEAVTEPVILGGSLEFADYGAAGAEREKRWSERARLRQQRPLFGRESTLLGSERK